MIKRILSIMLVCMGCLTLWAQSTDNRYGGDFNPTNPSDPAVPDKPAVVVTYRLTLQATEGGTVSHNQSGSDFQAGTRIRLTANVNANYKFKHWLQGDEVISTSTSFYYTMPAQAVTLKAVFEFYPGAYGGDLNPSDPSQPGVSVKSYKLTASASPASRGSVSCSSSSVQVGSSAYVNATANVGYRFTGWKCGDELVSTEPYYPFVMDSKDAHYTAYFEFEPSSPTDPNASSYTLTYSIGGRTYYSELLAVGTRIKPIATPVRKGHTFNGWSEIPDTMPNRNLTINGSFTARKHELKFIVDGEEVKCDSVAYGTVVTAPEVDVTGEKAFQWNNLPAIMPDHDVVVEGVYSSVKNVIIYRVDGEEYKRVEYEEGAPIYYEIPPIKEGYTFEGWVGVPTVMPQNYVVATGTLKPSSTFNIVYIIDGMKFHSERVASGEAVSLLVPKKDGYLFNGWSETLTTMPNHDVYLVGSFRSAMFDITYMVDGKEHKKTTVRMDDTIVPEAAPAKEGYTFNGWVGLPEKMPAKDLTVTASYVPNRYKVTYTIDGEVYHTDSIAYGTALTAIDKPVKEGHTFFGWTGLPATMPAKDVEVTGSFVANSHKIIYKVDGEVYHTDSLAYGTTLTAIAAPVKEGHTFSGWSEIPTTMPAGDIVVTGNFTVNTYKITYTVDGEVYHTDSVQYNDSIAVVEAPVKVGHTFSGWAGLPETMPAKDVTVTGTFVVNNYKVTYMVDGEVYKDSLYSYGSEVEPVAAPVKEGHTFSGWSEIPTTMPAGDIVVTGNFTVNTYKITYTVDGEEIHSDSIVYGTAIPTVDAPAKVGHTFSGWVGLPETMPAKDVTVTGAFVVNTYKVTYMVDGEVYKDSLYSYGSEVEPVAAPVKEGHTFSGWSEIPTTMPAGDIVVTGNFTVNTYKITYTVDGEEIHSDSIVYGTAIPTVDAPAKVGHTFSGWAGLSETMPAKDVTVTGAFVVNTYKVTYMVDGEVYKDSLYSYGTEVYLVADPVKEGYTFSGWSEMPDIMPDRDITVTGSFTVNTYKITYTVDGEIYHTDSVQYSDSIAVVEAPVKVGHTFSGWVGLPETMPAKDVTVTGAFVLNAYKVTYMVDGKVYKDSLYSYGSEVEPVAVPVKEGHTFSGWSEMPDIMPDRDITVTGSFTINTYKITYTLDGEVVYTDSVVYGTALPEIEVPEKEGHTFSGWSEMPETMPGKDLVVTGSFIVNSYTLSYVVDDSVTYKDVVYKYGTVITPEADLVKEGHTFSGWSEIPKTMPAGDVVVMGSFTVNTYKVTYMVDGEVYCTDSVLYGIPVTAVGEPVKEGASFGGWIGIPTIMPAKDVVVMGSFAVNSYMLTYMVDGEIYKSVEYRYGETITPETNPTKEGHTFSGWSEIPKTMPAGDVVVRGSFTVNTYSVTYMIDGEVYHTDSVVYSTGTTPLAEPTKEGYTFNGWSEIPDSMPANDVIVVGTFTVNTYRITYTVDGEEYFSNMVVYGSTITPPAYPVKEGYSFSGWGDVPETMPARDVTINGTFTINTYKVIYMVDGEVYYTDPVVYTGVVTPIKEPTKEGYTFSGWSEIPDSMPANDVTVRGSFILNAKQMDKQGLTYELNEAGNAFEISGYTEDLVADVVIPDKIYGLPVSAIQAISLAFAEMKSLVVPASVTTVGRKAFGDCEDLLTIEWNTTISLDAEYFSRASNYGNMLVYVADANTEFSFQGNVIVNGVAEQITLDDELPFRNIRNFTARNITFTKDFDKKTEIGTTGGWEAMILPFDVQNVISSDGKEMKPFSEFDYTMHVPYWLGEMRADGTFAATQSITANKPFIMQLPNSDEYEDVYNVEGEVTFSATNVTVYATTDVEEDKGDGYVMLGSYEGTTADNYICALNDEECVVDNKAYMPGCIFVADSRDIRPFEAYVYNAQIGRAPYLRISGENATGINHSTLNVQHSTIYDLTGRKVLNAEDLKGGVYIVNGRKVVVK